MTAPKRAAKFFCEYCGAEVPQHARVCKKCGRFFLSVRCPACGKTGNAVAFSDGCPFCGYAAKSAPPPPAEIAVKPPAASGRNDPLPAWLYIVCALACIAVLGALFLSGLR
jgi:rRNA maturation protein Nop10